MSDLVLAGIWLAVAAGAFTAAVSARRAGVAVTPLRDAIHVGAGLWPLGWPLWDGAFAPITLALAVTVAALALPWFAGSGSALEGVRRSISDEEERWRGIQLYAIAFAVGTVVAFVARPFPAAAALLALALGDGLGGAVGKRTGRHFYAAPGGKRKTVEGTIAVGLFSMAGVGLASARFGAGVSLGRIAAAGAIGAVTEALAPAASDNLLLPAAVWLLLTLTE